MHVCCFHHDLLDARQTQHDIKLVYENGMRAGVFERSRGTVYASPNALALVYVFKFFKLKRK